MRRTLASLAALFLAGTPAVAAPFRVTEMMKLKRLSDAGGSS